MLLAQGSSPPDGTGGVSPSILSELCAAVSGGRPQALWRYWARQAWGKGCRGKAPQRVGGLQVEWRRWPWLLVAFQLLAPLSALIMLLTKLPDALASLRHHVCGNSEHHTEEVGILKALQGEMGEDG